MEPINPMDEARAIIETLVEYLREVHQDEMMNEHYGDAATSGLAPEACTYCLAIDQAQVFLASQR